jgi:hypothetical protein
MSFPSPVGTNPFASLQPGAPAPTPKKSRHSKHNAPTPPPAAPSLVAAGKKASAVFPAALPPTSLNDPTKLAALQAASQSSKRRSKSQTSTPPAVAPTPASSTSKKAKALPTPPTPAPTTPPAPQQYTREDLVELLKTQPDLAQNPKFIAALSAAPSATPASSIPSSAPASSSPVSTKAKQSKTQASSSSDDTSSSESSSSSSSSTGKSGSSSSTSGSSESSSSSSSDSSSSVKSKKSKKGKKSKSKETKEEKKTRLKEEKAAQTLADLRNGIKYATDQLRPVVESSYNAWAAHAESRKEKVTKHLPASFMPHMEFALRALDPKVSTELTKLVGYVFICNATFKSTPPSDLEVKFDEETYPVTIITDDAKATKNVSSLLMFQVKAGIEAGKVDFQFQIPASTDDRTVEDNATEHPKKQKQDEIKVDLRKTGYAVSMTLPKSLSFKK